MLQKAKGADWSRELHRSTAAEIGMRRVRASTKRKQDEWRLWCQVVIGLKVMAKPFMQ